MKQNRWYRIITVVWMALGFFIQIYWYEKQRKTEAEWNDLWKKIAREFKRKMYRLEGLLQPYRVSFNLYARTKIWWN